MNKALTLAALTATLLCPTTFVRVTWALQAQAMEGDLSKYAAIVFPNSSGEELNEKQRQQVEQYMRGGGNAVVVHRAIISASGWRMSQGAGRRNRCR
ncbi:ThuA domain-containing protein [Ideonella sp. YS5]|uniref:ThuA domain-containing protein n=1 Tax=Ideonella sp. YS5 TaxID=3453714 RepID=UPI003EE8CE22